MTPTVIKRSKGCVTLSDGRRIGRMREGGYLDEYEHWWPVSVRWFLFGTREHPGCPSYRTLREALKAAGVQA